MSTEPSARRFAVTNAPALAPGQCFITKTGVGPFIDTKVDVSPPGRIDRGRVYISAEAVREMAEDLGLFDTPEDQKAALHNAYNLGYEQAMKENIGGDINRTIADLREFIEQLTAYMVPAGPEAPEDAGPVLQLVEPTGGSEPVGDSGADEGAAEPRPAELKKPSPRSRKRPNRLPADTGDDANLRI